MTASSASPRTGRLGRALYVLTAVCAVAYPLALAAVILAFRFIGERWWVTLAALYLPRAGFLLPLPFVVAAIYVQGSRRLMALQGVSLLLVVFPLMGFNPGAGRLRARPSNAAIRVVSYNISYGGGGVSRILAEARAFGPDLVLFQDAHAGIAKALSSAFDGWTARLDGQFFVASRYPIRDVFVPPELVYAQGTGGAHFVRYTIETPLGLVDVFNVHPTSPRQGLEEVRGHGLREEIASGRLFEGKAAGSVAFNGSRRQRQVSVMSEAADASTRAVLIAGDTNLPGLSWLLHERLGRYHDAFSEAGRGFGYTFPAKRPWMRIDRILTNGRLRALDFRIGDDGVLSDHRCVFAAIALNAQTP